MSAPFLLPLRAGRGCSGLPAAWITVLRGVARGAGMSVASSDASCGGGDSRARLRGVVVFVEVDPLRCLAFLFDRDRWSPSVRRVDIRGVDAAAAAAPAPGVAVAGVSGDVCDRGEWRVGVAMVTTCGCACEDCLLLTTQSLTSCLTVPTLLNPCSRHRCS